MGYSIIIASGCSNYRRYGGMTITEAFPDHRVRELARAAADGNRTVIDKLLAKGVNINATGIQNVTPLWWSIIVYNWDGFDYLLSRGADPNIQPVGNQNVMDLAAMAKDHEFLEAAVKAGGNVNLVSRFNGDTPIFSAIIGRSLKNIKLLLAHGADINFQNPNGVTPLIAAADINGYRMAYFLLKHGADPTLKTKTGDTVIFSIKHTRIDRNSTGFQWKMKVINLLKEKGINVNKTR